MCASHALLTNAGDAAGGIFPQPIPAGPETHSERMKARIDRPEERALYAARFGAVVPVFGNLCYNNGLTRFTLRGRLKVEGQWQLFCLVQNIEKLAHQGYAP